MKRREFLKTIGLPVLAVVGIVVASGHREPVHAGKRKGSGNSGNSGNSGGSNQNQNKGASGVGNTSGVSTMDLGSGRFKTDNGNKNDNSFNGIAQGGGDGGI